MDVPTRLPRTIVAALGIAATAAAAGPAPAAAQLAFGAPCAVLQERQFVGAERTSRVEWGQTLVVRSAIRIDCRQTQEPFDRAHLEMALPEGMTVFRIVEEDADGNDVITDLDPPQGTVRFTVPLDREVGWTIVERWYHVNVRPATGELSAADEQRAAWEETVAVQATGQPLVRLAPVPMQPLIVRRERPDAGCTVTAERTFGTPAPDGAVTVTLRLRPGGCRPFAPRLQALVAVPPPRSEDERTRTLTAVRGFDARVGPARGDLGALVGYAGQPRLVRPQPSTTDLFEMLTDAPQGPPANAEAVLRAALTALDPPPLSHGVLWLVGRADVPATVPGAVATVLGQAARRGIEVVSVCVGGGCDPAVPWDYQLADLTALRFHWLGGAVDAHAGAPFELAALRIDEAIGSGTYLPGSAQLDGVPAEPTAAQGTLSWTFPAQPDAVRVLRYALRVAAARERFTGSGTVRGVYEGGALRFEGLPVRLPRAVLGTGGQPPPEASGCVPRTTRTAAPTSILEGEAVEVRMTVQTTCTDVLRRSDVIAVADASRTAGLAGAVDVAMALRRMLWSLESPETHVGLIVYDRHVTRRIPLSRNYLGVHDLLNDIGSVWFDRFFAGQLRTGLEAALEEMAFRRPDAEARVVAVTGGEGDTAGYRVTAQRLRAQGARINVFCTPVGCPPELAEVASSPQDYVELRDGQEALDAFTAFGSLLREVRVARLTVTERLADGMALEPGSAVPPPDAIEGQLLTWRFEGADLPVDVAIRYRVIPDGPGKLPISEAAEAVVVDEHGRTGRAPFPPVEAVVFEPGDAGPCTPQLTRAPSRTVIHGNDIVTTTLGVRLDCPPRKARLDVVLAIDHSDSMRFGDRLANAIAAAGAFLDALDPAEVHVGLVAFGTDVTLTLAPTDDYAAVRQALTGIEPSGQTAIARALQAAGMLLAARRPDSLPALVLLTDGAESSGDPGTMLAVAQDLKDARVTIATVCAGTCDRELGQVASRPDLAFDVADSAQLVGLYAQLAAEFARARPRDVAIVDAYGPQGRPVDGAILPEPDRVLPDQADWTFDELPEGGLDIAVGMVPTVLEPSIRPVRFAVLTYAYGTGPDALGRAYFPPIELAYEPPPGPTPVPTIPSRPTPLPEPRFVFLPWAGR